MSGPRFLAFEEFKRTHGLPADQQIIELDSVPAMLSASALSCSSVDRDTLMTVIRQRAGVETTHMDRALFVVTALDVRFFVVFCVQAALLKRALHTASLFRYPKCVGCGIEEDVAKEGALWQQQATSQRLCVSCLHLYNSGSLTCMGSDGTSDTFVFPSGGEMRAGLDATSWRAAPVPLACANPLTADLVQLGPQAVIEHLGLSEIWEFWGTVPDAMAAMGTMESDKAVSLANAACLFFRISFCLDASSNLGMLFKKCLKRDAKTQRGPFAEDEVTFMAGGLYFLFRYPLANVVPHSFESLRAAALHRLQLISMSLIEPYRQLVATPAGAALKEIGCPPPKYEDAKHAQTCSGCFAHRAGIAGPAYRMASNPEFLICEACHARLSSLSVDQCGKVQLIDNVPSSKVAADGNFVREIKPQEHDCRLQRIGCLFPPVDAEDYNDEDMAFYVAALARACDREFQDRIASAISSFLSQGVEHRKAPPKRYGRIKGKLSSDHNSLEMPRVGNNADLVRCGLLAEAGVIPGLLLRIEDEFGPMKRCKNAFTLTEEEAHEQQHGYRAILCNWTMECRTVTYADVAAHLDTLMSESGHTFRRSKVMATVHKWLNSEPIASQPVRLLVETQVLLSLYLASRKQSHWPYKFLRCETSEQLALDASDM